MTEKPDRPPWELDPKDEVRYVPSPEECQRILDHWAKVRPTLAAVEPEKKPSWWNRYNAYLSSPEWEARRQKVLARSSICECCGEAKATQVHHLSYSRVGQEPLWDLRAVCRECHEILHSDRGDNYPVAPVMVSAAEWIYGARTWLTHIRHVAKAMGNRQIPDDLVERIGAAAEQLAQATPVETYAGRVHAYQIWLVIWVSAQELETGARPLKIENYYLPKRGIPASVQNMVLGIDHVREGST
jgi:5-methylcytosine-specific restriction endonuclease McrA